MSQEEAIDWEAETAAKKITDHFMASDLKEDDLKTYMELKTEFEALKELLEAKRLTILEKCKGMESAKAGNYVAFFKTVAGRKSVKWEKFAKAMIGTINEADLAPYTEQGEASVRLEIKKL